MPPLGHLGSGTYEPLQLLPLGLIAVAYAVRVRTLSRRGAPVPGWRVASFAAGLALILASLGSPLAHLGGELVLAHMTQHLLMADIGALLIVLGLTGPLLRPLLAVRWLAWIRPLAHPLAAFPLWAANLYLWHLPALYQGALTSEPLHALQHACFVGTGILMWMPLAGPLPVPSWFGNAARVGYVVAVRLAGTALGNAFMWSGSVFYPDYAPGEEEWGISPLTDQGIAGVIMTVEGGFVTLGVLAWLFLRWASEDEARQRLLDLAEERGVPLDEARAGRAVAAGEGDRLRERIASAEPEPRKGA